jgi:hypothetical protein
VVPDANYTTVDFQAERFDYPTVGTVLTPEEAYNHVVNSSGASKSRDRLDLLFISELQSLGTKGEILDNENDDPMDGPGPVTGGTAPVDTDGDGMPDDFEIENGLNPNVNDASGFDFGNGYSNIENYVNSLV